MKTSPIYAILLCYSLWERKKERCHMEVHDIADLAGRIGRGLMELVFTTCRVAIAYDWDTFNSKNTDTFQADLGTFPEDKLDALDAVFTPAKRLYEESKNKLTILSYLEHNGLLPTEEDKEKAFEKIKNKTSALAVWCVLNLDPEDIRELTDMVIIDAKSGNKWKTFEMEFATPPGRETVKEHEQEFADNLRLFVNQKEKCADFSHPLAYRVGSRQAFLLKMNDQTVELEEAKKDSSFEWVQFNPSVKLVVTLDDESNRICVHYRNGTHAKTIAERFCNVLFGVGGYKIVGEVHYDLSQFITNPKSNLGSDSKNTVRNVTVVGLPYGGPVVSLDPIRGRFRADTDRRRQEKKNLRKTDADLEDNLKSLAQYYKDSAIALARTIKKDWHKAESAAQKITQQTAADAVGVSDSRISDYLNKKDYEDNDWVLAARFWQGLSVDLQQLSIVADIIQTKLHHKLATIDKMDALSLYTQVLPHFIAAMAVRQRRCV